MLMAIEVLQNGDGYHENLLVGNLAHFQQGFMRRPRDKLKCYCVVGLRKGRMKRNKQRKTPL